MYGDSKTIEYDVKSIMNYSKLVFLSLMHNTLITPYIYLGY